MEVIVRPDGQPEHLIRAGYVVGADGMHSTVRDAIGMPFPGKAVVQSVMLADVRLSSEPPDTLTLNTTGHAFALIAPFGDGRFPPTATAGSCWPATPLTSTPRRAARA